MFFNYHFTYDQIQELLLFQIEQNLCVETMHEKQSRLIRTAHAR